MMHVLSSSPGLPLGLEAPVMTPNGVICLFFLLGSISSPTYILKSCAYHSSIVQSMPHIAACLSGEHKDMVWYSNNTEKQSW